MPRSFSRGRPANRHWTGFTGSAGSMAAGNAAVTLNAAQHNPETLMRMRGSVTAYVDGVQAPGTGAIISLGIIQVPEGTGTTVLWDPGTDLDAPWIWFDCFLLAYEEYVTDVIDSPGMTSYRSVIDSKSMRRLRNTELQLVFNNTTFSSALSINALVAGRLLTQD